MKLSTKQLVLGLAALCGFTLSSAVIANTVKATLSGYDETPSISTAGNGEFKAKIEGDTITFSLSYRDLSTNALFAHVHFGQQHTAGGVSFFLCGGGGKPACPLNSGTVEGTVEAADIIGPAGQGIAPGQLDEVIAAINAGATYVNIHTSQFPGGEIRGQIK